MMDRLVSASFRTLSALQANSRCLLDESTPWVAPLIVVGGLLYLGLVLLLCTCVERRELLPTPLRDAH
jgi:hypothetical protein